MTVDTSTFKTLALWKMEDNFDSTAGPLDSSQGAHHLSWMASDPPWTSSLHADGHGGGGAIEFNKNGGDYVARVDRNLSASGDVLTMAELGALGGFEVRGWLKVRTAYQGVSTGCTIFLWESMEGETHGSSVQIVVEDMVGEPVNGHQLTAYVWGTDGDFYLSTNTPFLAGEWHSFSLVRSGPDWELFLDDVSEATTSQDLTFDLLAGAYIEVGGLSGNSAAYPTPERFMGFLDEIEILGPSGIPVVPALHPHEKYWWEIPCNPYGSVIDQSGDNHCDFGRVMVLDMNLSVLLPGWGFPFSCTAANTSPCTFAGLLPSSIFAGGADGYIYRAWRNGSVSLGAPVSKARWKAVSGSEPRTLKIDATDEGSFFPDSTLTGLPILVEHASGAAEWGTVLSNTTTEITLSADLSATPLPGDTFLIAPMHCAALFAEMRFNYPAVAGSLGANIRGEAEQEMTIDIFTASGGENSINLSTPAARQSFLVSRLDRAKRIFLKRKAGKALSAGIWLRPVGGKYLQIESLDLEICTFDPEEPKQ